MQAQAGGAGTRRVAAIGPLLVAWVAICLLAAPASGDVSTGGSPSKLDCVAAATVPIAELDALTYNRHPEREGKPKVTESEYATAFELSRFRGLVQDLGACGAAYDRRGSFRYEFLGSKTRSRWVSLSDRWKPLVFMPRSSPVSAEVTTTSPFIEFSGFETLGTQQLGCVIAARMVLRIDVVEKSTGAIVARQEVAHPVQVDPWFRARCLGRISIHVRTAPCSKRIVAARAGSPPRFWSVEVRGLDCRIAIKIASKAIATDSFGEGRLVEQRIGGWWCAYAHVAAGACTKERRQVYFSSEGGGTTSAGLECTAAPKGVRSLRVHGASCDISAELASAAVGQAGREPSEFPVGGAAWRCVSRLLGAEADDRSLYGYLCRSEGSIVTFRALGTERLEPVVPSAPGPDVQFPVGPSFPLPVSMALAHNDRYEENGRIFLRLKVDPVLVGVAATVEIKRFTMQCSWTADVMETSPACFSRRPFGQPRKQRIVLGAEQPIFVAPLRRRKNWEYKVSVTSDPFTSNGLPIEAGHVATFAWDLNDTKNCKLNPWCYNAGK